MVAADLAYRALRATRTQWNDVRLIPSFSFVSEYDLYALPDSGPILNMVYGPVAALAYLPATLFSTPTGWSCDPLRKPVEHGVCPGAGVPLGP